ncbi:ATP-binding protein [Candidatus Kuenenbacteria bacterium]|nr:ATP-binding protein [Candidatus Kuenenbacteria bacterium]
MSQQNTIKVTVDKSHLFTLGEKMYRESIEFVRELVNNAYDADATDVFILVSDDKIEVQDNGSGMSDRGLTQFFTIGSEEKRTHGVSPRFGRKRIGQFGIGKFSALALADEFIVKSVKGKYKYTVIFNRCSWKSEESWELPIEKQEATPLDQEGTKIILNHLTKKVSVAEVEKYLKQSVPLRAKKFNVYLNNKKITAKTTPGKIISVNIKTMYGAITGEIILALNAGDVDESGVECRVKEVFIKREMFSMEKKYHHGLRD